MPARSWQILNESSGAESLAEHADPQPYDVSNAPGGFHEGGSLAGNDASEFSSTMSGGSDRFKPQRFKHRKSAAAAAMNANPTTYVRRRLTAMRISFDISCPVR